MLLSDLQEPVTLESQVSLNTPLSKLSNHLVPPDRKVTLSHDDLRCSAKCLKELLSTKCTA